MIIDYEVPRKVLLPRRIWEEAKDKEHFKKLVLVYMQTAYPDYRVKKVQGRYAICERK